MRLALTSLLMLSATSLGLARGEEVTAELAAERAALAATHMTTSLREDGGFHYEYDFVTGYYAADDNIVRQAGSGSALAEYLAFSTDPEHAARMRAALDFYRAKSIPMAQGLIVSDDGSAEAGNAGATALALLGELLYAEATGDDGFADLRKGWAKGLAFLEAPGGGFARNAVEDEQSPYYNGEAWLALAHYVRLNPQDAAMRALLERSDAYMIATYAEDPDIGFIHWGLMASSQRLGVGSPAPVEPFLVNLATRFMDEMRPSTGANSNSCSMVEGLAAAGSALAAAGLEPQLVARLADRAALELDKVLDFQILPDQFRIELGEGRYLQDALLPLYAGAFLNARYDLHSRIDYTQHCLSALIKFEALQRGLDG